MNTIRFTIVVLFNAVCPEEFQREVFLLLVEEDIDTAKGKAIPCVWFIRGAAMVPAM